MNITSINNVSFGSRQKKEIKKQNKDKYYKYISQFKANEAVKMSIGREVEDGRLKSASATAMIIGFFGNCAALIASSRLANKAKALEQSIDTLSPKMAKRFLIKSKVISAGFLLSGCAVLASVLINNLNESKADKTANDRGFLTSSDYKKLNIKNSAYEITDLINTAHIR